MLRKVWLITVGLSLLLLLTGQIAFSQETKSLHGPEIVDLAKKWQTIGLDSTRIAQVENLTLKRDVGVFELKKGELFLLNPMLGRVTGAVFMGEGSFKFSPPTDIERYQLQKFQQSQALDVPIEQVCFRFSDSTEKELSRLNYSAGNLIGKTEHIVQSALDRGVFNTAILADLVEQENNGLFFAEIRPRSGTKLLFSYNPEDVEEVQLFQESKFGLSPLIPKFAEGICSFDREDEYRMGSHPEAEDRDKLRMEHYKMDVSIAASGNINAVCEMDLSFLRDSLRIVNFMLSDKLKISQIKDGSGRELSFIIYEDIPLVSVIFESPSASGQKEKLTFSYSGDVLDRTEFGDFYLKYSTYWYPQYGYLERSTFDLTFKTPPGFKFVSIGKKVDEKKEKGILYTHWIEDIPVALASFNLGDFEVYDSKNEGIPEVIVYHAKRSISSYSVAGHTKEDVATDVANSLRFFQQIFGKCPFDPISVAETPDFLGHGYPGLLELSWLTFTGEQLQEENESFRAHEASHQWWGHIIGWKTYHDQWLSEGLAEYSGALYAQVYLKDNKKFFESLEEWKKDIKGGIKLGGGFESKGTIAGPVWLGGRLNSSKSFDYALLTYEKGAYVIHMLRNMLMDFKTMSDERFIQMMKDYVQTYTGKEASTEDFKKIVDKHFGEDMAWFFDQWVYGIEIPTYVFSWTKEKTEDGKYLVTLKINQENVSDNFKMYVPVVMNFDKDKYAIVKVLIDKPYTEVKLPKAPMEPKEIVFNPFYSVLCEVKYE